MNYSESKKFDHVIFGAGIVGIWLARRLLAMGRSVALVEIGPSDAEKIRMPAPTVHFMERENFGVTKARNHVVTGNSKYWGGGLMRNDAQSLCKMFDLEGASNALDEFTDCYRSVETQLEIPSTVRAGVEGNLQIAAINVLPGKQRNIAEKIFKEVSSNPKARIFCNAKIERIDHEGRSRIEAVTLSVSGNADVVVAGQHYVLSMGVVDSNIFALTTLLPMLNETGHLIGQKLHDHWSIPIATVSWKNDAGLDWLYPPTFRGSSVQVVHAEIAADCPWGLQTGFLHLQADYDQVEPYATIKRILIGRQQGRELGGLLWSLLPLARHIGGLSALAYNRYVRHRLFVPDGMKLNLFLDFESYPSEENRIAIENGVARLYWDVREQDAVSFFNFLLRSYALIRAWARDKDLNVEFLTEANNVPDAEKYLREHVVDTYHLGGGLAVGSTLKRSVVTQEFRFREIENLAAIGTATFASAGVANPVETLLAICERYCRSLEQ